ncbi:tautomerase family protein [Dolichospermum circinale CS-545/17]|nr:tautomerase family protein [Dolichospermum circinale CS-545/17]
MFERQSLEAKKQLIPLLFERLQPLDISPQDLEITIFETPISRATGG